MPGYAFQTQLFFLLQRWEQMQVLAQPSVFGAAVVSDFVFAKDAIFARLNLSDEEHRLYRQMVAHLALRVREPDLVIWLQAPTPTLLQRIRRRAISMEQGIAPDYLERLAEAYAAHFQAYDGAPVFAVATEHFNPAERECGFRPADRPPRRVPGATRDPRCRTRSADVALRAKARRTLHRVGIDDRSMTRNGGAPAHRPPRIPGDVHAVRQAVAARRQFLRAFQPARGLHRRRRALVHPADPELRRSRASRALRDRGQHLRAPGRPDHRRGQPAAPQDLHHADRSRADPPAHQRDGRHPRSAPGRDRDDVAVRREGDDRRGAPARRHQRALLRAGAARGLAAARASASRRRPRRRSRPARRSTGSSPTPTA